MSVRISARATRDRDAIGKQRLLFTTAPQEGEHPVSWMLRLAWANGLRDGKRIALLADPGDGARTVSSLGTSARLSYLADVSAMGPAEMERLAATSTEKALGCELDDRPPTRWRLRAPKRQGVRSREADQAMQICPECLREDSAPYWRRDWSISLFCRCSKHGCVMRRACATCGEPTMLSLHRRRPFDRCDACGESLAMQWAPFADDRPPCAIGWSVPLIDVDSLPAPVVREHLHWDGVWVLVTHFSARGHAAKLAAVAEVPTPFTQAMSGLAERGARICFDELDAMDREVLLEFVGWLLISWPARFVDVFRSARLSLRTLAERDLAVREPFWLWAVARSDLQLKRYRPNAEEVASARSALAQLDGRTVSRNLLRKKLGVSECSHIVEAVPIRREAFTERHACELIATMRRSVERAPAARSQRAALVRDCLLVAVCLLRGISWTRGVGLSIAGVQASIAETTGRGWRRECQLAAASWLAELTTARLGLQQRGASDSSGPMFMTRFGRAYRGNGIPHLMVGWLRDIGYGDPERGIQVAFDLQPKH